MSYKILTISYYCDECKTEKIIPFCKPYLEFNNKLPNLNCPKGWVFKFVIGIKRSLCYCEKCKKYREGQL